MSQYITGKARKNIFIFHYLGTFGMLFLIYFLHIKNLSNFYLIAELLFGLLGTINVILFLRNPYYIRLFRIYKSPFSSFTHTFIAVIALFVFWLPFGLNIAFSKPHSKDINIPQINKIVNTPTVKPTEIAPSPTILPEAITLTNIPEIYPEIQWSNKVQIIDEQTGFNGEQWKGEITQNNGKGKQFDTMFYNTLYSYYEKGLLNLNWIKHEHIAADGPTGIITGFIGYKENTMRIVKLSFSVNNWNNQCGSGGCACPCTNKYEIFISNVVPKQ